jgi:hypothetical protein
MTTSLSEIRVRTTLNPARMKKMVGKMIRPEDIDIMLTGPTRVLKPDGTLLAVYLPQSFPQELRDLAWGVFHSMKGSYTTNRGYASGSQRVQGASKRTYARAVDSAVAGAFDPAGPQQFCRLTAWTGAENEKWRSIWPVFQHIGSLFEQHVPDRFAAQMQEARNTAPEWVVPGTPFTTITINNTYATAVHKDKGDLDKGFSTLACFREGEFRGGWISFPEYRVAADMQDGDLLLMDAHAWHGNTPLSPEPLRLPDGRLDGDPGFERISVVSYFRTAMVKCGSAEDEAERQRIFGEQRMQAGVGE